MAIPTLTSDEAWRAWRERERPYAAAYGAMYSSLWNGIVTDPALMFAPLDDHVVHRGDGVFEAMRFVDRRMYALDRHLARLERSAEIAQLPLPRGGIANLKEICLAVARASGFADGYVRLYVTRGPGGFSVNPYESVGTQTYAVATKYTEPSRAKRTAGATALSSSLAAKDGWFATVKSCNYLQNALIKKEAVDSGVDYAFSFHADGTLAEGAAENCAIVTPDRELIFPRFARVLRGITATRVLELARQTDPSLNARESDVREADVRHAKEILALGTAVDVLSITTFDGRPVGDGQPGPVASALFAALAGDQRSGPEITML